MRTGSRLTAKYPGIVCVIRNLHNTQPEGVKMNAFLFKLDQPHIPVAIGDFYNIGPNPEIRQARIEKKTNGFILRDLRAGVETQVNGQTTFEAPLSEGDIIQSGTLSYRFSFSQNSTLASLGLGSKNIDWQEQLTALQNVATTDFSVLLLGPSGTGKDILAQAIHKNSSRNKGPFLSVNCSALTETLIESELFGHVKGSFTGALNDRKGAFEAARSGTLFLDEIGDLPYALQSKLLRALENSEIRPVGSDRTVSTDLRIIAATHQDLKARVQQNQFRADLYFRLNVVQVSTPALKNRMEDFDDLFYQFAKNYKVRFSFDAIEKLKKHSWPGNIRELKNVVARASALYPKQSIEAPMIDKLVDAFGSEMDHSIPAGVNANLQSELPVIKEIERQMIIKRMLANRGNQKKTASDLGMPKSTLHDRLKTYQIDITQFT